MELGDSAKMGPALRAEVERQLLADLEWYGVLPSGMSVDWSGACQEGHRTQVLDGNLEGLSELKVVDASGALLAEGWMDFVHGGGQNPLFVFWLFLSIRKNGRWAKVRDTPMIPSHVWKRLPVATKDLCLRTDTYDARWADDPKVREWGSQKRQ